MAKRHPLFPTYRLSPLSLIASSAGLLLFGIAPGLAQVTTAQLPAVSQLSDGTVFFNQIPQLVGAHTYDPLAFTFSPTYFVTISVPATSLVPLQRVQLAQISGSSRIVFLPDRNQAYLPTRPRTPINLTLLPSSTAGDAEFLLDPPIQPGQEVVLVLNPYRNPTVPGVYQFAVTVYPVGEKVIGNMTGTARLQFYNPGSRLF